jgi:hypothetical protein
MTVYLALARADSAAETRALAVAPSGSGEGEVTVCSSPAELAGEEVFGYVQR